MNKRHTKLQSSRSLKTKKSTIDNSDSDSQSTLSIDPNETLVNDIAHKLFRLAIQQTRDERKFRRQNKKFTTIIDRPTIFNKKKKLKTIDIDRVFEEKRLRPYAIKSDLLDLYQKSSNRIRSLLDIHQIDQFLQAKQTRKLF
ncbi:hypothetical protein I4U23_013992 [Adineta vaga]|nr:hypothetical protein I4U23_013992 [Adineta vaga]